MRIRPASLLRAAAALAAPAVVVGLGAGVAAGQSVRCVTLTGRQAPAAPAGTVFATLDQPVITSTAGVVFRATVVGKGVGAANDVGIWRYPTAGAPTLVAREADGAATMTGVILAELGQPVADAVGAGVGYWARLQGNGITALNDRAMFVHDNTVAFPWYQVGNIFFGTPAGPVAGMDDYRDHPTLNAGGLPAFAGTLESGLAGVFAIDLNTDSLIIGRQGDQVQTYAPGILYGAGFSSPQRDSIGDVVFRYALQRGSGGVDASNDQAIMVRMAMDGAYFDVVRTGQLVGHGHESVFDSISEPSLNDEPRVGFGAGLRRGIGGVDATNDAALCSLCPCGSIALHVQRGWAAPAGVPGLAFDSFSVPHFSDESRMLFGATLRGAGVSSASDSSVWWLNQPVEFVMAAREGAAAPGGGGATFADFNIGAPGFWVGSSTGSQLVFQGQLSDGRRGLWVFTPNRGTRALVIEGQSIEVGAGDIRQIVSLTPMSEGHSGKGRRGFVSEDRQVVFRAGVTGGQTGVFVADLPAVTVGCPSDWDNSGVVNSQDFFDFLTDFFSEAADINNSGATDSQDFFDFLTAFFTGC